MPTKKAIRKFSDEELITLIKAGYSNKECADKLGVSPAAISLRRRNLSKELQLQAAGEAQQNLLSVPTAASNLRLLMDETKNKLLQVKDSKNVRDYTAVADLMLKIISYTINVHKDLFRMKERQELKDLLLNMLAGKSKEEQIQIIENIREAKEIQRFIEEDK